MTKKLSKNYYKKLLSIYLLKLEARKKYGNFIFSISLDNNKDKTFF